MKLIIPRADVLNPDLIIGSPGYTVWKGKRKEVGGDGLEGEEMRTCDPILELDLDDEHLLYLIKNNLLDAETCQAFFNEEGHVSLKYLREKHGIKFIDFQGTIFRDLNGLPCVVYLCIHPKGHWEKGFDLP